MSDRNAFDESVPTYSINSMVKKIIRRTQAVYLVVSGNRYMFTAPTRCTITLLYIMRLAVLLVLH